MDQIRIDTFGSLLVRGCELACYCPGCRRWASTDLAMVVGMGLGDRPIASQRPQVRAPS